MLLSNQEILLLEHIRRNGFGCLNDGLITDDQYDQKASISKQERKLVEVLREYKNFVELKYADGVPVSMLVSITGPPGIRACVKSIRF